MVVLVGQGSEQEKDGSATLVNSVQKSWGIRVGSEDISILNYPRLLWGGKERRTTRR